MKKKNKNSDFKKQQKAVLPASTRLLLSVIAAVLNTLVTLPLDVISSQQQAGGSSADMNNANEKKNEEEKTQLMERQNMHHVWNSLPL